MPEGEARLEVGEEEYLLDAIEEAGYSLPFLCRRGWCLTCAATLLEGEVDQSHSLRYYPQDREAGFVLLCTGRPRSPLRLCTHRREAMQKHRLEKRLPTPRG